MAGIGAVCALETQVTEYGYRTCLGEGGLPFVLEEKHKWLRKIALDCLDIPADFWKKMDALPAGTASGHVLAIAKPATQIIEPTCVRRECGYRSSDCQLLQILPMSLEFSPSLSAPLARCSVREPSSGNSPILEVRHVASDASFLCLIDGYLSADLRGGQLK
jgi:hypothetical protein